MILKRLGAVSTIILGLTFLTSGMASAATSTVSPNDIIESCGSTLGSGVGAVAVPPLAIFGFGAEWLFGQKCSSSMAEGICVLSRQPGGYGEIGRNYVRYMTGGEYDHC